MTNCMLDISNEIQNLKFSKIQKFLNTYDTQKKKKTFKF